MLLVRWLSQVQRLLLLHCSGLMSGLVSVSFIYCCRQKYFWFLLIQKNHNSNQIIRTGSLKSLSLHISQKNLTQSEKIRFYGPCQSPVGFLSATCLQGIFFHLLYMPADKFILQFRSALTQSREEKKKSWIAVTRARLIRP